MTAPSMKFVNNIIDELKPYIRHIWIASGNLQSDMAAYLLPMEHTDLIIPIRGDILYGHDRSEVDKSGIVFHGIRTKKVRMEHVRHEHLLVLGITFEPYGFYPFVNSEMSQYMDEIVPLVQVNQTMAQGFQSLKNTETESELIAERIQKILAKHLAIDTHYSNVYPILRAFCQSDKSIDDFCLDRKTTRKNLERYFKKYIGISPKSYIKIRQFEDASRLMLYEEKVSLTDVALESDYYDQAHFSREFKSYTNDTPSSFKKEKSALKSNLKFE